MPRLRRTRRAGRCTRPSGDTGGADCGNSGTDSLSSEGVEVPGPLPTSPASAARLLSVTTDGGYVGETTWSLPMMSQGSGGGVSTITAPSVLADGAGVGGSGIPENGEVPDVAADARSRPRGPLTSPDGPRLQSGGGTSLATPISAGFTLLSTSSCAPPDSRRSGLRIPMFYRLGSRGTKLSPPPFHDVTVGGNVFYPAGPGTTRSPGSAALMSPHWHSTYSTSTRAQDERHDSARWRQGRADSARWGRGLVANGRSRAPGRHGRVVSLILSLVEVEYVRWRRGAAACDRVVVPRACGVETFPGRVTSWNSSSDG